MNLFNEIHSLVEDIKSVEATFRSEFKTPDVLRFVKSNIDFKNGSLPNFSYSFHGVGCRVRFKDRVVNFDYTPPRNVGGFSVHDLLDYLKSKGYQPSPLAIENELNEWVQKGELLYPELSPNTRLYFLKSDRYVIEEL